MVFSSISFIFFFLSVFFLGYYLLRGKWRIGFLLLASLIFYSWGELNYLPLMLIVIAINYLFALFVERFPTHKRLFLILAVTIDLMSLFFYKYFTPLAVNVLRLPKLGFFPTSLPLGISFFTFQAMSYVIDVYRGKTKAQKNLIVFGTYITMFPQLIAGPIVRYSDIETQINGLANRTQRISLDAVEKGIQMFLIGLAKKVLLGNMIGEAWQFLSVRPAELGILGCWFGAFCYTLQIYYDFSGYSDMAIGLGGMMGFSFPKNFDHPYAATSVTDFWRRWHMTLSGFFRDYVYFPLGGSRKGTLRTILNMLIVWALTGLWHGASATFVVWGLFYWMFLVLERFVFRRALEKIPAVIRTILLFLLVSASFMIFYFDNFPAMGRYFSGMFNFSAPILGANAISVIGSYWVWFLMGLLCAGYLPSKAYHALARKKPVLASVCRTAALLLLFVLCIAALVRQSYNPFIYFRF
jgi:alginate O-acetyltransferase complex protein AlgI